MPPSNRKIVRIEQKAEQKKLSTAQKQFNSLIKNIDASKKLLLDWQEIIPQYQHKVEYEYTALWDVYNAHKVEMVYLLDGAHNNPVFTKSEKAKIKHLICDLSLELLSEHGKEEVKELHNKYSGTDFDADKREAEAFASDFIKSMMHDMYGVELGDDIDVTSPEKMQAAFHEKLQEMEGLNGEKRRQAGEGRGKRKKSAKQLEKEAEQQREKQNASKSIQEVFRKLATALHPDREPDAKERERKTEIMQRVNVAYAKKDLLQLLELQLEAEQIDQEHLNNIAESRLKYFNKILKEQLAELQQEVAGIEFAFRVQLDIPPFERLNAKRLMRDLSHDIEDVRHDIASIKHDLQIFQTPASLKAWLKGYKIPKKRHTYGDMDDLRFGGFMPPFGFQ